MSKQADLELSQEEAAEELERLGQALAAAAKDKKARTKATRELEDFLAKLTPEAFPDIAASEVVQSFIERLTQQRARSSDDPPGTIYNRGSIAEQKKPWQARDLEQFPKVRFTPGESIPVFFNGLRWDFHADVETECPSVFYDIYMRTRQERRTAREHAEWIFGKRDTVSDPTVLTPDGARARATGEPGMGHYLPGGGAIALGNSGESAGTEEGDAA